MRKIGVLVCSNGLGHIRRIVQIIYNLQKELKNFKIDIFFDFEKKRYLKGWKLFEKLCSNEKVFFKNFNPFPHWPEDFKNFNVNELLNWHKEIVFLKNYDYVISDNFLEPLLYNKKTIISGSFLWHHIYFDAFGNNGKIKNYFDFCNEILEKYNPKIIVNKYFFYPALKNYPETIKIGMLKSIKRNVKKKREGRYGVLFSFSASAFFNSEFEKILTENKKFKIYFDKRMKEKFEKSNFKVFSYEKNSFSKIHGILGFAGIGTITESIGTQTPLFVLPSKNPELVHNSIILEKLNVGRRISSVKEGLEGILEFYKRENYKKYLRSLKKLDKNGLEETLKFIKKFIREN